MGLKKIAKPINKAKNDFIKWLKKQKATDIDIYTATKDEWDYYVFVSAFIRDNLYMIYFMVWKGEVSINYSDGDNSYKKMSIEDFLRLIN